MGKGSPITSSTQGSPSPMLPRGVGILVCCKFTGWGLTLQLPEQKQWVPLRTKEGKSSWSNP